MNHPKTNIPLSTVPLTLAALALLVLALVSPVWADRAPDVPANLVVPAGNEVSFHVYAKGVQIYQCTQDPNDATKFFWKFLAPDAELFANAGYQGQVGIHYAGPTWESTSGSKVVAKRVDGSTVDPSAIPWLLLKAVSTQGPGIFEGTTYIQRVNTTGGIAPTSPCGLSNLGEIVRVPYTAEYFFYRPE